MSEENLTNSGNTQDAHNDEVEMTSDEEDERG